MLHRVILYSFVERVMDLMDYHIPDDVRHTILEVVLVFEAKHAGRALD